MGNIKPDRLENSPKSASVRKIKPHRLENSPKSTRVRENKRRLYKQKNNKWKLHLRNK